MQQYTLKGLAESGYVMGLATIGEVASHMLSHYDAYFLIANLDEETRAFSDMLKGHLADSVDMYLSDEEKKQMDAELDAALDPRNNPEWGLGE